MIPKLNLLRYNEFIWLILIAITSLFLITLAMNHSEAEDSVRYIYEVTKVPSTLSLYDPNHILFNSFNRVVYDLWLFLGYKGNAELPMQINNVIAGIVTLFLVYLIARRLEMTVYFSLLCLGMVSMSYGFWRYSVEAETYILPLPFILLSAHRLMIIAESRFEYRHFFLLGLFMAMATLFHQQHVLLIFIAPLAMCCHPTNTGRLIRCLILFFGVSGAIIAAVYFPVAIFLAEQSELGEIIKWSQGKAVEGLWTPWAWTNPLKSIFGLLRSIWGTLFLFGFPWFEALMVKLFPLKPLMEERLVAQSFSTWQLWLCLIMVAISSICAVILSVLAVIGYRRRTELNPRAIGFIIFSVPMLLIYAIFNTLWEPLNIEFWIALLPFIYLVLMLFIRVTPFATIMSSIFVVALLIGNLLGSILPQTDRNTDYCYISNQYFMRHAQANDYIITGSGYMCSNYLYLYTDATLFDVTQIEGIRRDSSVRIWINRILNHQPGRVLISSTVFDPPNMSEINRRSYQKVIDALKQLRKSQVYADDFQIVWEL
ncbi:MAG: glycosyltransferase family 39 protein [Pseudomonadota bacterium]